MDNAASASIEQATNIHFALNILRSYNKQPKFCIKTNWIGYLKVYRACLKTHGNRLSRPYTVRFFSINFPIHTKQCEWKNIPIPAIVSWEPATCGCQNTQTMTVADWMQPLFGQQSSARLLSFFNWRIGQHCHPRLEFHQELSEICSVYGQLYL